MIRINSYRRVDDAYTFWVSRDKFEYDYVLYGQSRNVCLRALVRTLQETFQTQVYFDVCALASPVENSAMNIITVGGEKYIRIRYFCEEPCDNFHVDYQYEESVSLRQYEHLYFIHRTARDDQLAYLEAHPMHGFTEEKK